MRDAAHSAEVMRIRWKPHGDLKLRATSQPVIMPSVGQEENNNKKKRQQKQIPVKHLGKALVSRAWKLCGGTLAMSLNLYVVRGISGLQIML